MKDLLTIIGLVLNMAGCGLLYIESARVSAAISTAGPFPGGDIPEEKAKKKDRILLWMSRSGFILMGVGFAVQILAIYL